MRARYLQVMTRLAIIDYGSGNVRSVQRALEAATGLDSESVIVRPIATAWLAKNR